jgi:hypothetical protein
MLQADSRITAKAVRERLHNEYGATPSYPTVRHLHRDPAARPAPGRPASSMRHCRTRCQPSGREPDTAGNPPQAALEEATARLLHVAFLEIRFLNTCRYPS